MEHCSSHLRGKALREDISLDDLLKYGRSLDASNSQRQAIKNANRDSHGQVHANGRKHQEGRSRSDMKSCYYCGGPYGPKSCPAAGKTCRACGKPGHFQRVCKSTPKHDKTTPTGTTSHHRHRANNLRDKGEPQQIGGGSGYNSAVSIGCTYYASSDSASASEHAFTVISNQSKTIHSGDKHHDTFHHDNNSTSTPFSTVKVGNAKVKVLVDSGASFNILSHQDYEVIKGHAPVILKPTKTKIHAFG